MDLRETDEQQLLRKSVAQMAGKYGHEYLIEKARTGGKTTELWKRRATTATSAWPCPPSTAAAGPGWSSCRS